MTMYVATVLIEVENSFEGRKPDERMIISYLENRIKIGEIKEESFRRKVFLKILGINISVMSNES